jgi:hypothetical protein
MAEQGKERLPLHPIPKTKTWSFTQKTGHTPLPAGDSKACDPSNLFQEYVEPISSSDSHVISVCHGLFFLLFKVSPQGQLFRNVSNAVVSPKASRIAVKNS